MVREIRSDALRKAYKATQQEKAGKVQEVGPGSKTEAQPRPKTPEDRMVDFTRAHFCAAVFEVLKELVPELSGTAKASLEANLLRLGQVSLTELPTKVYTVIKASGVSSLDQNTVIAALEQRFQKVDIFA